MPLKQQFQCLNSARVASIEFFKKKKTKASSLCSLAGLQIDNDKLSTRDSSDTEGEFGTWFWNKNTNDTDLDFEEREESDINKEDWEEE